MSLRYVSLFDGIGAACVAWKSLGWQCVGKSEIEPFPIAVTTVRQPGVPHLGSVSDITEEQVAALGRIDLIVGGFPCQDLSVAGKRTGLRNDDGTLTRSGLFFDAMRVVRWARQHCGLRWLLIENVPGLYSSNRGRDFAAVVGEMAGAEFGVPPDGWRNAGVAVGPDAFVEWATLDAQFFGLAQRRVRVFALADFGGWQRRPPVLLEPDGLRGHPAPRREARKGAAAGTARGAASSVNLQNIARGGDLSGTLDTGMARGNRGQGVIHAPELARCVATREGSSQDWETTTMVAHALRAEGFDASEDGTGRGTPLVPVGVDLYNQPVTGDLAATLSTTGGGPQSGPSLMAPIAFHPTQDPISSEGADHALGTGSAQGCATAAVAFNWQQGGGPTTSLACNTEQAPTMQRSQSLAVAFRADAMREGVAKTPSADAEGRVRLRDPGMGMYEELAPTLDTGAPHGIAFAQNSRSEVRFQGGDGQIVGAVTRVQAPQQQTYIASHMQVRRLTPLECCRLQGFPDTYLDITYRGKPAADGPKYKALGNSMAVPVMRWIGERIAAVEAVMQREEVTA